MKKRKKKRIMKRRKFLKTIGVVGGAAGLGVGGYAAWDASGKKSYRVALDELYRPIDLQEKKYAIREIARYATMAANSHNTQPWRIELEESAISFLPDEERKCPSVDPDDHHLFISLGCAAENAVQTAAAFGLKSDLNFNKESHVLRVEFSPRPEVPETQVSNALFEAIPERQSTRADFDGVQLTDVEWVVLRESISHPRVQVMFFSSEEEMEEVLKFVVEGNRSQMKDSGFVAELRSWIRMSYADAIAKGDGLFGKVSGNPALPDWLGKRLFDLMFNESTETKKYEKQVRSSAGIAVFIGGSESPASWVEVGRCFEHFALLTTSMGILHSHLNQPVEVPDVRRKFADFLGIGSQRPDLVIRFGKGQPMLKSLRRPLEEVIDQDSSV